MNEELAIIWKALESYRGFIPEGIKENDKEWNDICTAMAWLEEDLNSIEENKQ
jgi:hypothetical protein